MTNSRSLCTLPLVQPGSPNPRIPRLAPLDAALDRLAALTQRGYVLSRLVAQAIGTVLAADVHAATDLPSEAIAYADGWAVAAEDVAGATAYGAAILSPPPLWVEAGSRMPAAADAILPPEAATFATPDVGEVSSSVAPGEGVRNAGQDVSAGALMAEQGTRLTARHVALLGACGIENVDVRVPRVRLIIAGRGGTPYGDMVRQWLTAVGAEVTEVLAAPADRAALSAGYAKQGADLVVSIGGTGQGRTDCAVAALSDVGAIELHGIAMRPGTTAAFGHVGERPVLLVPGRIDAMVAGMLILVAPAVSNAAGLVEPRWQVASRLASKVTSTIGVSELFLGMRAGDELEPVPLDGAGLDVLVRAVGWFMVPPGSEGYAAGETVHLRPFRFG